MGLNIQTNVAALDASRSISKSQKSLNSNFNKLSTGFRVNSAADDASGLAISESMKSRIRSYTVAERNAADGISMSQTAEGALSEVHDVLGRMRELAMQSANGILNGAAGRTSIQNEFESLGAEITRIRDSTNFNGRALIASSVTAATINFQVGVGNTASDKIGVAIAVFSLTGVTLTTASVSSATAAQTMLSTIDTAIDTVSTQRAKFGAAINRLEVATSNIQTMRQNLTAANSRIVDVDVAEESAKMAKNQVLSQTSVSVMAQANQMPQLALKLLG